MGSFLNCSFWHKESKNEIFIQHTIIDDTDELTPFYMQRDWDERLNAIEDRSLGNIK